MANWAALLDFEGQIKFGQTVCEQQAFPREQTSDLDLDTLVHPKPERQIADSSEFLFYSFEKINIPSSSTASACSKHRKTKSRTDRSVSECTESSRATVG